MDFGDLYLYIENEYVNSMQNGRQSANVVIEKADYFSLMEICNEMEIRYFPFFLGFNSVTFDFTEDEDDPEIEYCWLSDFDVSTNDCIRVILEWDAEELETDVIEITLEDPFDGDEDDFYDEDDEPLDQEDEERN